MCADNRQAEDRAYEIWTSATQASASTRICLKAVADLISRGSTKHVQSLLREIEDDLAYQDAANVALLDHIPPASRKPPNAAGLAFEVFGLAELLEQILAYLPVPDLLDAYLVNKKFRDTIQKSVKLQRKLGLLPHPESNFFMPAQPLILRTIGVRLTNSIERIPHKFIGIEWYNEREDDDENFKLILDIEPKSMRRSTPSDPIEIKFPRLGSRCAKMLLCQPPTYAVRMYMGCCNYPNISLVGADLPPGDPCFTIKNGTGVTTGNLYEAVDREREKHRFCVGYGHEQYDVKGHLRSKISLHGEVTLRGDDPIYEDQAKFLSNKDAWEGFRTRMMDYDQGKRDGKWGVR